MTDGVAPPVTTAYVETTSYLVIPEEPRRRKQVCGGTACCMCLSIFLLLFFLIPRYPSAVFRELEVDASGTVQGKFEFKNNNFYEVTFKDPRISMYWLAESKPAGAECSFEVGVGRACGTNYNVKTCAIELGKFDSSESFKVASQHKKNQLLHMSDTVPAYVVDMTVQAASKTQLLMSKGHLKAESDVKDFGKVSMSDTIYCFY